MKIYRKRYIPNEIVDISGDEVLFRDEKKLITRWKPIKPRGDLGGGISCIFFDLGIKVSKFFNVDGSFRFWYCDIIDYSYDELNDEYVITDLLLDVVIYPDGHYEVLDEDELELALKQNIITEEIEKDAIRKKNILIDDIVEGRFKEYIKIIEAYQED